MVFVQNISITYGNAFAERGYHKIVDSYGNAINLLPSTEHSAFLWSLKGDNNRWIRNIEIIHSSKIEIPNSIRINSINDRNGNNLFLVMDFDSMELSPIVDFRLIIQDEQSKTNF